MSEYMNTASGILYNAVTYSRLSDDDVDKSGKRESDSIVNQKGYTREFLKSIPENPHLLRTGRRRIFWC